jgi:predicted ATPase
MDGKKLLHSITLKNLLSYGEEGVTLELEPLNVLIGPNASGKSNLIDAVSLLAAAPRNLLAPFREGGVADDWIWKGNESDEIAMVEVSLFSERKEWKPLTYQIRFSVANAQMFVWDEALESAGTKAIGRALSHVFSLEGWSSASKAEFEINSQLSVLSQFRDPQGYPKLTHVGDQFSEIRFFRGWPFGRGNPLRKPQEVNLPDDFLLEDGSNLGLILNHLQNQRETKRLLLEKLRLVYEGIEDVTTKVQGGTIQIFFHEEGLDKPIPAARLSDGTLHYLCLLTVLLHPDPPPLICIEEPELGLHPDILPHIAELLIDASKRTQLIVTTHSETLVSALSDVPEAVVVCERDASGTKLRRLDPDNLKEWLERYRLGELWAMGEIGGNR